MDHAETTGPARAPHHWRGAWWAFALGAGLGLIALVVSACSFWLRDAPAAAPAEEAGYARRALEGEPLMRVRLERNARESFIEGPARIAVRVGPAGEPIAVATPAEVRHSLTHWVLTGPDGQRAELRSSPEALIITREPGTTDLVVIDGIEVAGEVWLWPTGGTGRLSLFDVVEHVPAELYLPGVLAKELYAGWHIETYRAQAVAARSYALHERQRRLARGDRFDVERTTQDQAYGGTTTNSSAHRAVRDTRGAVLTWRGSLLRAYYSSTTGGRAASARDTWPTGPGFEFNLAAPIQASERDSADAFSPRYRWRTTRTADELVARFRAFGAARGSGLKRVQRVAGIDASEWNAVGRPSRYRVAGSGGRAWELSAEDLRLALNYAAPGYPTPRMADRALSGDLTATFRRGAVELSGRGFGHGVGMSQFGAEGLARRGWTAERILAHFYPGSALERAY